MGKKLLLQKNVAITTKSPEFSKKKKGSKNIVKSKALKMPKVVNSNHAEISSKKKAKGSKKQKMVKKKQKATTFTQNDSLNASEGTNKRRNIDASEATKLLEESVTRLISLQKDPKFKMTVEDSSLYIDISCYIDKLFSIRFVRRRFISASISEEHAELIHQLANELDEPKTTPLLKVKESSSLMYGIIFDTITLPIKYLT